MAAAPWYLNQNKPGLKHQKAFNLTSEEGGDWYKRGVKTFQATKFRKGACENCGAMTHKKKDCVERPRKAGAVKTGKNIAADELLQDRIALGFDGKRDRYNGYDAEDYGRVVDRYERAEALKAEVAKKRELERAYRKANRVEDGDVPADEKDLASDDEASSSSDSDDDAKAADADTEGFMEVKKRVRSAGGGASMTVRNLRIREDTAKYLRNLDLSSAHYDPKTRSMRENPLTNEELAAKGQQDFVPYNEMKMSGDASEPSAKRM